MLLLEQRPSHFAVFFISVFLAAGVALCQEFLSWEGRLVLFENLLTEEECDYIIAVTKQSQQYSLKNNASIFGKSVYFDYYPRLDPKLQEIERRLGAITGTAPHPDEEPINIHHVFQYNPPSESEIPDIEAARQCLKAGGTATDCNLLVENVHHDKVGDCSGAVSSSAPSFFVPR